MITVVSGVPRSGTSLMMQVLQAGGLPILTDDARKADENNPRGYFEYSKVKRLPDDASWLSEAEGRVLKIIADDLFDLPTDLHYKVVFMLRDMDEVIASQKAMLDRLGRSGAPVTDLELKRAFSKLLNYVENWINRSDAFDVLYVDHHRLMEDPSAELQKVNEFLGGGLDVEKMTGVVDRDLYRTRR